MRYCLVLAVCLLLFACGGQTKEELLREGDRLKADGNFRGAIVLYKNALEKDVNYLEARAGLANAYLGAGRFDLAEKEFKKVLLQNPSADDIHLKLATLYIERGEAEKAILELEEYHSENPESAASLNLYGRSYGVSGDLETAEGLFNKALLIDAGAIKPRMNLAKVFLQRGDEARATTYLKEVISLDQGQVAAYYSLATIESRSGRLEEALKVYQDLVKIKPDQIEAHYMSGLLQMELGRPDAALQVVDTISAAFPGRAEGTRLKGIILSQQRDYAAAKVALEKSLTQERHLLTYFFLGLSYYGLDQYEQALNQFQGALDLNPDFERARILVAMTLLKQKRVDDAVIEIRKVLRANPASAYAHNILGSALLSRGDYDDGMAELQRATELDPTLADAHLKRGLFHLSKGQGAEGESDLIKALEAAPEVLNSRLMLVTHYLRQKNYTAAIDTLQTGMDGSAGDALLYNHLAAAYFSQKKPEKAVGALKNAKQKNPDYLTPYFNLASYHVSRAAYAEAVAEYRAILARDARNTQALLGLAAVYGVQGDTERLTSVYQQLEATGQEKGYAAAAAYQLKQNTPDAALSIVDRGLEKHRSSVLLLEMKGGLHQRLKQAAAAETAYTRLVGVDPELGNRRLFRFYLQSGQAEKAAQLVQSALVDDSGKDYPYSLSASLLRREKQYAAAIDTLLKGIAAVRNPLRLQMQLGSVYEAANEQQKAEQLYRRVLEKAPRFSPAYVSLGFLAEGRGDKGRAQELYREALSYDPGNPPALNNLAFLLADNFGQEQEALELALRAFRRQPNDPRIMDTLGYVMVKNKRAEDAVNLLEKASQMLPAVPAVKLHLALAKSELGQAAQAKELLDQVIEHGGEDEVRQAQILLKSL